MSWTLRIDHPDVVAVATGEERAALHATAEACRELWDACAITSFVHEEHVHSVCKIIARMQRRQMTRIREAFEDLVRHTVAVAVLSADSLFQMPTGITIPLRPAEPVQHLQAITSDSGDNAQWSVEAID